MLCTVLCCHYTFLQKKVPIVCGTAFFAIFFFSNHTLQLLVNTAIYLQMAVDLHYEAKTEPVNSFQLLVPNRFIFVGAVCRKKRVCKVDQAIILTAEKKSESDQEAKKFERRENVLTTLEIYFADDNSLFYSYYRSLIWELTCVFEYHHFAA